MDPKGARSMIHITREDCDELMKYRHFFGAPNFFKLFRSFYKLANIPEDAQNNPFSIILDENSVKRGFEDVFGIKNQELSLRFASLLTREIDHLPKVHKVGLLRFLYVI